MCRIFWVNTSEPASAQVARSEPFSAAFSGRTHRRTRFLASGYVVVIRWVTSNRNLYRARHEHRQAALRFDLGVGERPKRGLCNQDPRTPASFPRLLRGRCV